MSRAYYSRNGSRIPNPYVDNARPGDVTTWATVEGRPVKVRTWAVVGPRSLAFVAHLQGYPAHEGRGIGPSEAVGRLDKLLFQGF